MIAADTLRGTHTSQPDLSLKPYSHASAPSAPAPGVPSSIHACLDTWTWHEFAFIQEVLLDPDFSIF